MLMSGLAGIFKFDPRDLVNRRELDELARGIDRIGPDGGAEHLAYNLGIAYRAFHTTPESHFETQPLVRRGLILTWDGRLDNREEIRSKVSGDFGDIPTDIDLVFAAYEKWGTTCFAELMGDWALALWDHDKQQLILARDYIGVRRLFYRLDEGGIAWCTTIEPLVLTSTSKLHLDLDYLAGCLYPRPPVETTPYREIRSVVPASFLAFHDGGKHATEQYWSLNPHAQVRYSSDSEYEDHFREVFGDSVRRRLRADRTLLAELSGGIDSSSIVCMADDIRKIHSGPAIETLSYYDTDEPSGDERSYFTLVEEKRGRAGHHISISDFARKTAEEALEPLPDDCFAASPGYCARSLHWASTLRALQNAVGARIILSGLGGDEVLGGIQYEAPELADHLLAFRFISFLQSAIQWSMTRKKNVYRLLMNAIMLVRASRHPELLFAPSDELLLWACLKPPTNHTALKSFARWRQLSPVQLCMESIRYCLAQQLTCTDLPLVGCAEQRYPYLDRSLFVFLASIPRTQVLAVGRRRHLMRRALRGIVPNEVLFRKTKWFTSRHISALLRDQKGAIDNLFKDYWLSDRITVDAASVRQQLEAIQHGRLREGMQLYSAIAIEEWLRWQRIASLPANPWSRNTSRRFVSRPLWL
jgi:asparagine synthase (glutamine-hydrolysing)